MLFRSSAERIAQAWLRSERVSRRAARVPAGRYQKAPPSTRMQTAGRSAVDRAREQLAALSTDDLQQAQAVSSENPELLALIEAELAKRGTP